MSLGNKVWIYQEKKRWTELFKVLGIADANITVNTGNGPIIFRNTHVRPNNCPTKETNISDPEMANGLVEIPVDKSDNKEIPMLLDYPKPQRPYWRQQLWKNHLTNDFTDKMATIFINHRKQVDYELALQLWHEKIITTLGDLFEQSNATEIEFLLANAILQLI